MRRQAESGFALLFVFVMASIIAISLFFMLPRISFEAQRDKEALLIERGEQYKRGIQLYVRKFKRYPAKMEDLDNANGIRFLRHRYKDPMTGKDEWRLIHAGPGGVLLDSLVKKDSDKEKKLTTQSSISELLGTGGLPEADATANRHFASARVISSSNPAPPAALRLQELPSRPTLPNLLAPWPELPIQPTRYPTPVRALQDQRTKHTTARPPGCRSQFARWRNFRWSGNWWDRNTCAHCCDSAADSAGRAATIR